VTSVDRGLRTKNLMISCKLLDHKSILNSQLTGMIPYHLSYDYHKLITKAILTPATQAGTRFTTPEG